MALRIAIVEDDPRWRSNLEALLRETEGLECVGSYPSGEAAIADLPQRRPQVVLMDINLPKMSGVECTRQLRALLPEVQIVMLTVYDDSDRIFQALQMGANGYLLKRASADEILQAIQDVHRGGAPMSAYIARKVVQSFQQQGTTTRPDEVLSKREAEVLGYVSRGYSDKEVAEALGLTPATVRSYLKTIYGKLHVHSRTQAIAKAAK
ncbi:MAG TPA: response regulator transcription factor [Candidatus Paceibacterota bacterium]|nr:response regulator transcription factor [Verrucomicrobiota bacterium]HSA11379.1 response regulator transcription factor [Candidatus Paceibacterota bacterium]